MLFETIEAVTWRSSVKKAVLKSLAKSTGKYLRWSAFLVKFLGYAEQFFFVKHQMSVASKVRAFIKKDYSFSCISKHS